MPSPMSWSPPMLSDPVIVRFIGPAEIEVRRCRDLLKASQTNDAVADNNDAALAQTV